MEMGFLKKAESRRNIWVSTNLTYETLCSSPLKCQVIKILRSHPETSTQWQNPPSSSLGGAPFVHPQDGTQSPQYRVLTTGLSWALGLPSGQDFPLDGAPTARARTPFGGVSVVAWGYFDRI